MNKLIRGICWNSVLFLWMIGIAEENIYSAKSAPISLDFQEVDVRKVLHTLAKFTQRNLIIEGKVQGKVTLHLVGVLPEEALVSILRLQNLKQECTQNTCIIRPNILSKKTTETPSSPFETKKITLRNRSIKEIDHAFFKDLSDRTQGGDIQLDAQSNSLQIKATPQRIQAIEAHINRFDHVTQQVLIEARIVSVNRNFDYTLGTRFRLKPVSNTPIVPVESSLGDIASSQDASSDAFPLKVDLPHLPKMLNRAGPFLFKGFNRLLDVELAAMENEGNGRVISSPHLITTNKSSASIEAGSEIPYQEQGRYGTSIAFKKAVMSLHVTPEIIAPDKILLKLEVHHDKPGALSIESTPTIDTQKLKTQVLIKTGETVALGGIYETVSQENTYRVPILGYLPLLGWLFKQKATINTTHELLVFVTPHLLSEQLLAQRKTATHFYEQ